MKIRRMIGQDKSGGSLMSYPRSFASVISSPDLLLGIL